MSDLYLTIIAEHKLESKEEIKKLNETYIALIRARKEINKNRPHKPYKKRDKEQGIWKKVVTPGDKPLIVRFGGRLVES